MKFNNFKINKFNAGNVAKSFGSRVEEIAQATKPALLDLTVVPDFNDAGQPIAWIPSSKVIKTGVVRKYNLFGQEIQIKGTIYKLEKGGKEDTYFFPEMKSLKDVFESSIGLLELHRDMMFWSMQARTISSVAQGATSDPNLQMFIGTPYLEALISDDEVQFSRVSMLQALEGEKLIFNELLKMLAGGIQSAGIVPETVQADAKVASSSVLKTFANNGVSPKFSKTLAPLGGKPAAGSPLKFGASLGGASSEAGSKVLKSGLNLKK